MAALRRIACLLAPEMTPERAGQGHLLDVALAHSPRVEEGGPGLVYLDVAGLHGLYGERGRDRPASRARRSDRGLPGPGGNRRQSDRRAHRGAPRAMTSPSSTPERTRSISRPPRSRCSISPPEMAARLDTMGNTDAGRAGCLAVRGLVREAGQRRHPLQRLARGEDARPLRSWAPPLVFEESIEPGWAVETLGPLGDLLAGLVERICDRLVETRAVSRSVRVGLPPGRSHRTRGKLHAGHSHERARGRHGAPQGLARVAAAAGRGGGRHAPGPTGTRGSGARIADRSLSPEPAHARDDPRPARRARGRAADRRPRAPGQPSSRRGDARAVPSSAPISFGGRAE